jgi:hypothetical protein
MAPAAGVSLTELPPFNRQVRELRSTSGGHVASAFMMMSGGEPEQPGDYCYMSVNSSSEPSMVGGAVTLTAVVPRLQELPGYSASVSSCSCSSQFHTVAAAAPSPGIADHIHSHSTSKLATF